MSIKPRTIVRKCLALVVVAATAIAVFELENIGLCQFYWQCIEDDAALRADALLGPFPVLIYLTLTLVAVFAPATLLRRKYSVMAAAMLPALIVAAGVSVLLFRPGLDSVADGFGIGFLFAVPWISASAVGCAIWPDPMVRRTPADIDCFD